jgi:hypothetical protein
MLRNKDHPKARLAAHHLPLGFRFALKRNRLDNRRDAS